MAAREPRTLSDYLGKPPGTTDPRALKMKEFLRSQISEAPDPQSVEPDGIEHLDSFLEEFLDEVIDMDDKVVVPRAYPGEDRELWLIWPSDDGGFKLAVELRSRRGSHSILVRGKGVRFGRGHLMIGSGWSTVRGSLKVWRRDMRERKADALLRQLAGMAGPSHPGIYVAGQDEVLDFRQWLKQSPAHR